MPARVVRFRPGDRAQKEHAQDRNEVAEALPVDSGNGGDRNSFATHFSSGTSLRAGWFPPADLEERIMPESTQRDAIALLKKDHRKVEELFKEFEGAKGDGRKEK